MDEEIIKGRAGSQSERGCRRGTGWGPHMLARDWMSAICYLRRCTAAGLMWCGCNHGNRLCHYGLSQVIVSCHSTDGHNRFTCLRSVCVVFKLHCAAHKKMDFWPSAGESTEQWETNTTKNIIIKSKLLCSQSMWNVSQCSSVKSTNCRLNNDLKWAEESHIRLFQLHYLLPLLSPACVSNYNTQSFSTKYVWTLMLLHFYSSINILLKHSKAAESPGTAADMEKVVCGWNSTRLIFSSC